MRRGAAAAVDLDTAALCKLGVPVEVAEVLRDLCADYLADPEAFAQNRQTATERLQRLEAINRTASELISAIDGLCLSDRFGVHAELLAALGAPGIAPVRLLVALKAAASAVRAPLAELPVQARRSPAHGHGNFVAIIASRCRMAGVAISASDSSDFMLIVDHCLIAAGIVDSSGAALDVSHYVRRAAANAKARQARIDKAQS